MRPPFRSALLATVVGGALAASVVGCDGTRQASAEPASAVVASGAPAIPAPTDSVAAARADSVARARQDSINRARPDYVVDSILPIEEQLRRFRDGTRAITRFEGGARSRDALLTALVDAIERADTLTLDRLTLTRDEYAWLVYPTSVHASGPMQQAPQVAWFLLERSSASGRTRLLARLGGKPLGVRRVSCDPSPEREGDNRIVVGCRVERVDADGSPVVQRLFGSLISRGGSWKVMSWANGF